MRCVVCFAEMPHSHILTDQSDGKRAHGNEEKDMTVLLRWILGTCLGTCDMDLTDRTLFCGDNCDFFIP